MTAQLNRDLLLVDRTLRRKADTATDDQDWYTAQVDPGAVLATVAGVAQAGDLTVTVVPRNPADPVPDPIVFTVTTETLAEGAEALADAVTEALASTAGVPNNRYLALYLARSEYTAGAEDLWLVPNPHARDFTLTMAGTGTMTLTFTPDDIFPITDYAAKQSGQNVGTPPTHVIVWVVAVTAGNDVLGIGTCTFDMQVLRAGERYDTLNALEQRPSVADLGTLTGLNLGEEVTVPMGGGRWGVGLSNVANLPATGDALEVRYREVVR